MAFLPFPAAKDIGDRFLSLLHRLGINPPVGSQLEDELLSLTQLIEVMKNPNLAQGPAAVPTLRGAAAIHDLAAKVLSVEHLPDFGNFVPHLRLIADTEVRVASLGQNAPSGGYDDTARKFTELYIACLAAHVGTDVALDPPTNSRGDNPDVIFTLEEVYLVKQLKKWALAIKTISSRQGQTIFERIQEGADQINSPRCKADFGMVVVNAKSAIDHNSLWNTSFSTLQAATDALVGQLDQLAHNATADRPQTEWDEVFKGKVVRPVIFMGQSLVRIRTEAHAETPSALKVFKGYDFGRSNDHVGLGIAAEMNKHMQNILLGIPGGQGQEPR